MSHISVEEIRALEQERQQEKTAASLFRSFRRTYRRREAVSTLVPLVSTMLCGHVLGGVMIGDIVGISGVIAIIKDRALVEQDVSSGDSPHKVCQKFVRDHWHTIQQSVTTHDRFHGDGSASVATIRKLPRELRIAFYRTARQLGLRHSILGAAQLTVQHVRAKLTRTPG